MALDGHGLDKDSLWSKKAGGRMYSATVQQLSDKWLLIEAIAESTKVFIQYFHLVLTN